MQQHDIHTSGMEGQTSSTEARVGPSRSAHGRVYYRATGIKAGAIPAVAVCVTNPVKTSNVKNTVRRERDKKTDGEGQLFRHFDVPPRLKSETTHKYAEITHVLRMDNRWKRSAFSPLRCEQQRMAVRWGNDMQW